MTLQPQTILLVGAPGSGKGTQYTLLREYLLKQDPSRQIIDVQTGQLLRDYITEHEGESFFASRIKEVQYAGNLQPPFIPIHVWTSVFLQNDINDNKHILIDGIPRAITEAYVLDSVFYFFKRTHLTVIYFEVDESQLRARLMGRGRHDDTEEVIVRRMTEYYTHTVPVIEYLKQSRLYNLHTLNADRPIEDIHNDIVAIVEASQ